MAPRRIVLGATCLAGCVAAAAAAGPPPSPLGVIGGLPKLPAGKPGTISVVAQGRYGLYSPGTVLPVVIRNSTKRPVTGVYVTGTALSPKGRTLADGQDEGVQPAVIPPAGLALAFVRFGGNLPAGTRFKLTAAETPAGVDTGYSSPTDMAVTGLRYARGQVTGTGANTTRKKVYKTFDVFAACFDRSGVLVAFGKTFGRKAEAAPGQKVPFALAFARSGSAPVCAHVLVSMIAQSQPI